MKSLEYAARQLRRCEGKIYENYVVSRIVHGINDPEVQFVAQQYIRRSGGRYALSDLYFPQLNYSVEVDEGHHHQTVELDRERADDIYEALGDDFKEDRIGVVDRDNVPLDIRRVNAHADRVIEYVLDRVKQLRQRETWQPWSIETAMNPQTYIKLGFIKSRDNVAFRCQADAMACFGTNGRYQGKGAYPHPREPNTFIWFPKLIENDEFNNSLNNTGKRIQELSLKNPEAGFNKCMTETEGHRRVVFAYAIDSLGKKLYRFKGVFRLNIQESHDNRPTVIYKLENDTALTYRLPNDQAE